MRNIIWLPATSRDFRRFWRFLAPKNLKAAADAIDAIYKGVEILRLEPGVGRQIEGLPKGYKKWPISYGAYGYVALYHFDAESVTILSLKQGKERDFPRMKSITRQANKKG
ncbi:MAG: type II toxin-antitoxin system RelE/ParE family toxin [Ottowia sp.]|nr:type II toxin-antitoxin system RelE/ParE family toxin [Ottowia sp.]